MKKPYEFTREDDSVLIRKLFYSIDNSQAILGAIRSVLDLNQKDESNAMWGLLDCLLNAKNHIERKSGNYKFCIPSNYSKATMFYANRDLAVKHANIYLKEANPYERIRELTHTLSEVAANTYGDKLLEFGVCIYCLMTYGDRSEDSLEELLEDIGIDAEEEYVENEETKRKIVEFFNKNKGAKK